MAHNAPQPSQTKRSIAIVLPNLAGGGAEGVNVALAAEFLARGFEVMLVLMEARGELLGALPGGARIVDLGASRLRSVPVRLARYLRQARPDAIIANMWPLTAMCVIGKMLAQSPARLLLCEHGTLSLEYQGQGWLHRLLLRASLRFGYRFADAGIAVSSGMAADLARLAGIDASRIQIIHNPIPPPQPAEPQSEAAANALWSGHKGGRVLAVGSFKPVKNQASLIRAFAKLARKRDVRLMLLGEGPLRGELERLAQAEGVGDRVSMPGFFVDPSPFYRSADVFALSSDHEGFANVIVEALGCGLPVVSTDCPSGPAEILGGGRHGILVPVGDEDALADALAASLDANHDRDALKRRADDFSPAIAADKYLALMFPASPGSDARR